MDLFHSNLLPYSIFGHAEFFTADWFEFKITRCRSSYGWTPSKYHFVFCINLFASCRLFIGRAELRLSGRAGWDCLAGRLRIEIAWQAGWDCLTIKEIAWQAGRQVGQQVVLGTSEEILQPPSLSRQLSQPGRSRHPPVSEVKQSDGSPASVKDNIWQLFHLSRAEVTNGIWRWSVLG